jgi:two-component system, OmpR family, copper resistance phosphate regulon response regulator CusR
MVLGGSLAILVIEDDEKLASSLEQGLRSEEYDVVAARSGEDGFFLASQKRFELVILDLMLPGRDGLEILTTMRRHGIATPVLILTARDSVRDRVLGLDSGADDYLVKPFAFSELSARIRVLIRRGKLEDGVVLKCDGLELDPSTHTARRSGVSLALTAREFEILEYLLRSQGRIVSREMLAREVWKEVARHTPLDNVIDVNIARLRRKIDDGFTPKLLNTVRGVGFILRDSAE